MRTKKDDRTNGIRDRSRICVFPVPRLDGSGDPATMAKNSGGLVALPCSCA